MPPYASWVKLNMDRTSKGNPGISGGDGALRDSRSFCIEGFLIRLDICNSLRAELIAYFYGLRMAWNKGYQKLHVEVNSYTFIQLMTKVRKVENLRFHNIISQYRNFLSRFWQVRVTHCHRESNMVANKLVNITVACLRRLEFISFNPNAVVDLVD